MKVVSKVSDPPALSDEDVARIQRESRRLHDAFTARTACMETLTAEDLKIRVKSCVEQPTSQAVEEACPLMSGRSSEKQSATEERPACLP